MTETNDLTRYFQKIQLNATYGASIEEIRSSNSNEVQSVDFNAQYPYPSIPSKPLQKRIKKGI